MLTINVLDWHIQQSRFYARQHKLGRAYAHLQISDKYHISDYKLKLKYVLANSAALAFIGLHQDALRTAHEALAEAGNEQDTETLKTALSAFIETETAIIRTRPEVLRPQTVDWGKMEIEQEDRKTRARSETRFDSSRPRSASKRGKSVLRVRKQRINDFLLENDQDELKARSRLLASEYEAETQAELSKKFSASGLAATQKGLSLKAKEKLRTPEKISVADLAEQIRHSHDQPIICETLRELGIPSRADKRVDGSLVLNLQGLLMRQTSN